MDATGNVYVADTFNNRIQRFTSNGTYLAPLGGPGSGDGQFSQPWGVAVHASGDVYAADTGNGRVQVFGSLATPAQPTSWGRIKALYR